MVGEVQSDIACKTVSPCRHLVMMVAALFASELVLMGLLAPRADFDWIGALLDASVVAVLAFAFGYVLMAAPLRRALQAQCESEQQMAAVFEHAPLGIVVTQPDGSILRTNRAFSDMLGYGNGGITAQDWRELTHPEDIAANQAVLEQVRRGESNGYALEKRYRRKDGEFLWSSLTVKAVRRPDQSLRMLVAMIADISSRKRADDLQRLATAVFETSGEGMMVTDALGRIQLVNPAFSHITGYPADQVLGRTPSLLSSGRHGKAFYAEMWQTLGTQGHWHGEVWNRRRDGTVFVEHLTISALHGADGAISHYIGVFGDFTQLHRRFEDAIHRANFDALTGLPNRALLWDRLSTSIAKMRRDGDGLAVLFIDLDGFKPINDSYGHLAGYDLLRQVAGRLQECLRDSDTLARLGGDEFVVVSLNSGTPEAAGKIADKIQAVIGLPFHLEGGITATVGASVGIAVYPDDGDDPRSLLANADAAMYDAKRAGKGTWRMAQSPAAVA